MDPRRPIRWRPRARHIAAISATAFVALTGLLGARVAMGDDPALRAAKPAKEEHSSFVSSAISTATGLLSDDVGSGDDGDGGDDRSSGSSPSWSGSAPSPSTGTSGG